jgi:ribosome-associated protein
MDELEEEIRANSWFKTSRSSGSGGQHVNKVETKVELIFDLTTCDLFTQKEITLLHTALESYIHADGFIHITCQESRSQIRNKQIAVQRLYELIEKGRVPKKKRVSTKPTRASKEKRIKSKKYRAEVKANRKKPDY